VDAHQLLRDPVVETRGLRATIPSAVISSCGGALRPRLDRVLRAVAADGNAGRGRFVSSELSERFAALPRIEPDRLPERHHPRWQDGSTSQDEASRRTLASGPSDGEGGRPAGEPVSRRRARCPRRRGSSRVRFRSAAPKGGSREAARGSKLLARRWSHGHPMVGWDSPPGDSTRDDARGAVSLRTEPGPPPSSIPFTGVTRRWQPGGQSFSFDSGLRVTRRRGGTADG
jgi:hypothetical protein